MSYEKAFLAVSTFVENRLLADQALSNTGEKLNK